MRLNHGWAVAVVGFAFVASCKPAATGSASPSAAALEAAADSLDQAWVAAFNSGNAEALMAVYFKSPNVVSVGLDGSILVGYDALKVDWDNSLAGAPGSTLAFSETHNKAYGDAVLGWGRWILTAPSDSGPPKVIEGPYTNLKAWRDGKLHLFMDHASIDQE